MPGVIKVTPENHRQLAHPLRLPLKSGPTMPSSEASLTTEAHGTPEGTLADRQVAIWFKK